MTNNNVIQKNKLVGKSHYNLPSDELVLPSICQCVNLNAASSCEHNIHLLKARGPELLNEF